VHAALGYDRRRMTVIENGIALDAFAEDPAARRRQRMHWRVAEDEVVIGMVARWDPQKDHCNLLQALSQVHAERWRAVLVGPGMDTGNANLMGTIAACGLTGRVLPVGPSADMPGVMNGLDLHVLSSAGESFGNVTAEAMACGTPAVVTSVGAGPRLVGEYGWVVPPRDAPALAGAVSSALAAMSNREAWQIRREASRRRIRDHFGADVMARSYNEVWRAAAGSR
jgi:glycosyltransferase involved in cell wall biosynthesis